MKTWTRTIEEIIAGQTEENSPDHCPLPVGVIPDHMGINLCSVESIRWARQDDGQVIALMIQFLPSPEETDPIDGTSYKMEMMRTKHLDIYSDAVRDLTVKLGELRNERDALLARVAELEAELERERMRLAACGVAAMSNTDDTVKQRITPDNPYYSASYADVCGAVDREMALRAERDRLREACSNAHTEWVLHGSLTDSDKTMRTALGITDEAFLAFRRAALEPKEEKP